MKRRWPWVIAIVAIVWIAYVAVVYSRMNAAPGDFNQFMAGVPMPAMMLVPFETLWFRARAGVLEPGDPDHLLHLRVSCLCHDFR